MIPQAIEAFRIFGWETLKQNLSIVAEQAKWVGKASDADDLVDADKDGQPSIFRTRGSALAQLVWHAVI